MLVCERYFRRKVSDIIFKIKIQRPTTDIMLMYVPALHILRRLVMNTLLTKISQQLKIPQKLSKTITSQVPYSRQLNEFSPHSFVYMMCGNEWGNKHMRGDRYQIDILTRKQTHKTENDYTINNNTLNSTYNYQ